MQRVKTLESRIVVLLDGTEFGLTLTELIAATNETDYSKMAQALNVLDSLGLIAFESFPVRHVVPTGQLSQIARQIR